MSRACHVFIPIYFIVCIIRDIANQMILCLGFFFIKIVEFVGQKFVNSFTYNQIDTTT